MPSRESHAQQGLTDAEAAARRARGEGNVVATTTSRSQTRILVENLVTPVNVVLFAIAIALVVLRAPGDQILVDDKVASGEMHADESLLTVGNPTFALAVWTRSGATPRRLLPSAGHFVLPAAVTIAAVALVVYSFYTSTTDNVELAQAALTTTVVLCGLVLIPFVQPPSPAWVRGAPLNGDWRPTALSAALLA
ncbi:MAG: hypothetical protein ACRDJ9_30275, partial [Dehalococcoidia bacterium]